MNRINGFIVAIASLTLMSCGEKQDQSKAAEVATVSINIPTIQCGTCKKNVETALMALDGVRKAEVDLKGKTVAVEYVAAKLDLSALETSISKAGYAANDMKADSAAYEKLDECCKVDGHE